MKFRQIVVGVDFSPNSRQALREAAHLRRDEHTGIAAVHVIDTAVMKDLEKHLELNAAQVREQVETKLRHWVDEVAGPDSKVFCEAIYGHPYEALVHAVERHQADLLVLGSRGLETVSGHPGAVAIKCLRRAAVDVMLVRRAQTGPFRHVLACVDFSPTSVRCLELAAEIAGTECAAIEALHVHVPLILGDLALDPFPPTESQRIASGRENAARSEFRRFLADHAKPWPKLKASFAIAGSPNEGVIDHIREQKPDLVVLGTRGRTGLKVLLLGTTAERLIHEAPASLLVVKEPRE